MAQHHTPPPWVFGPVWSILYLLMAAAAWLVWRQRIHEDAGLCTGRVHGAIDPLNVLFGLFVFFGLRRPGAARRSMAAIQPYTPITMTAPASCGALRMVSSRAVWPWEKISLVRVCTHFTPLIFPGILEGDQRHHAGTEFVPQGAQPVR